MSSASLAVAQHAHPDTTRIVAISAAIVLNLAVIVIASRPITSAWHFTVEQPSPVQWLRLIDPPAVSPPPPPIGNPSRTRQACHRPACGRPRQPHR